MVLMQWMPTWPRMRMPNRAVLPGDRMDVPALGRLVAAETYPAETDPPAEKTETGRVEE